MSDGTAFRAAGVRLKKMRGSGLRSEPTLRTTGHFFLFGPENLRELRVLLEELAYSVGPYATNIGDVEPF